MLFFKILVRDPKIMKTHHESMLVSVARKTRHCYCDRRQKL